MGKLANLKPSLAALSQRIAINDERGRARQVVEAPPIWRRWYHTKRWADLRMAVLVRDLFTCRMCGRLQADTSMLAADHRRPHRGNEKLFWDIDNIQTLCADPCHNTVKKREEASMPPGMWD